MYERATRFGRSNVTLPFINNAAPKRVSSSPEQKTRKFLRDYRLRRVNELMERHKGDLDYDSVMGVWRREKCDLLEQEIQESRR